LRWFGGRAGDWRGGGACRGERPRRDAGLDNQALATLQGNRASLVASRHLTLVNLDGSRIIFQDAKPEPTAPAGKGRVVGEERDSARLLHRHFDLSLFQPRDHALQCLACPQRNLLYANLAPRQQRQRDRAVSERQLNLPILLRHNPVARRQPFVLRGWPWRAVQLHNLHAATDLLHRRHEGALLAAPEEKGRQKECRRQGCRQPRLRARCPEPALPPPLLKRNNGRHGGRVPVSVEGSQHGLVCLTRRRAEAILADLVHDAPQPEDLWPTGGTLSDVARQHGTFRRG
jgi:hypothetical protein